MIVLGPRPDGPQDLLDEPMQLSLADKVHAPLFRPLPCLRVAVAPYHHQPRPFTTSGLQAKLGIELDAEDYNREHMQAGHFCIIIVLERSAPVAVVRCVNPNVTIAFVHCSGSFAWLWRGSTVALGTRCPLVECLLPRASPLMAWILSHQRFSW